MADRLLRVLSGAMGAFAEVAESQPRFVLAEDKLTEGYLKLSDGQLRLRLMPDDPTAGFWSGFEEANRAQTFVGATEHGPVLISEARLDQWTRSFGGSTVPVDEMRCSSLVAGMDVEQLTTSRVRAVRAVFMGEAPARWAGVLDYAATPRLNRSKTVVGFDIRVRKGKQLRVSLPGGLEISLGQHWRAVPEIQSGLGLEFGLRVELRAAAPRPIGELVPLLFTIQDLLGLAFAGYVRASRASAWIPRADRRKQFLDMWQFGLMPDPGDIAVGQGEMGKRPMFALSDLGGPDGLRRWIKLYESHPRVMQAMRNSIRFVAPAPEAGLLDVAAVIEHWVNAHKGRQWISAGKGKAEPLALRAGVPFRDWVGHPSAWASDFWRHYNGIKHNPSFVWSGGHVADLGEAGRLLLLAALLDRVAGSRAPSKELFRSHHNLKLGRALRNHYDDHR